MSRFWLALWTAALSLAWLIPNHFPPWSTFHSDAWFAALTLVAACWAVCRPSCRQASPWPVLAWVALGLALVPWAQWGAGLLFFSGQAWMSSIYLLGLATAVVVGARWEGHQPNQVVVALLVAMALASVASVGLQLATWLGVESAEITSVWSMGLVGNRPYANVGQPNLLATLLVCGLLGTLLAYQSRWLGAVTSVVVAVFLLTGLALTQSRTGQLELLMLLGACFVWRAHWRSKWLPWAGLGLLGVFVALLMALPWLYSWVWLAEPADMVREITTSELRLPAWKMFLKAVWAAPLWGYGWTEVTQAQLAMADTQPWLGLNFAHSHNLLLDLVLWLGLPLGGLVGGFLVWTWIVLARGLNTPTERVAFLAVSAMGLHAMLELPLHHATFLLPAGLLLGFLCARRNDMSHTRLSAMPLAALVMVSGAALAVTVHDYLKVEAAFYELRFKKARFAKSLEQPVALPDVWVLNQMRALIWSEDTDFDDEASAADLATLEALVRRYPRAGTIYRLARLHALAHNATRAEFWLARLRGFSDDTTWSALRTRWAEESQRHPRIAAVPWPLAGPEPRPRRP